LQRWVACSSKYRGRENHQKFKLETLVRSVGASLQTTIHAMIVYELKGAEKREKRPPIFFKHILRKNTRLHLEISRSLG